MQITKLLRSGSIPAPLVLTALFLTVACPDARAHAWLAECDIKFDNNFALTNIFQQARGSFAESTGLSPSGQLERCDPARHQACWFYRERCGTPGYVNVDALGYPHYHLSFEDPTLTCFANGGFGRMINGVCVAADWAREPRVVQPHSPNIWTKIWLEDRVSHMPRVFDVASVRVGGNQPIQFWFQKTDGSWWFWSSLGPGLWDLSRYAFDVMEVLIFGADGALQIPTIESIFIRA